MATLTNINTPTLKPAAAPLTNVMAVVGDQFAAVPGAKYLLRFTNASATSGGIFLDDPVSVSPADATTFVPDVTISLPAGQVRTIRVDTNRFRDPTTGMVVWTYTANMSNAGSLLEIYGPE